MISDRKIWEKTWSGHKKTSKSNRKGVIVSIMAITKKAEEAKRLKDLEYPESFYYNEKQDSYILFIKSLAKNVVITGDTHRGMLAAYCGEDPRSVEDICMSFEIPKSVFAEWRIAFGVTRDSINLSDEEIESQSIDDSVRSLLEKKKFEINQKFNKLRWADTEKKAEKWETYQKDILEPVRDILGNWEPKVKTVAKPAKKVSGKELETFFCLINDWHAGAKCDEKKSFRKLSWNKDQFKAFVKKYTDDILGSINEVGARLDKIVCLLLGDLLDGLDGKTQKGTHLTQDVSKDEQFNLLVDGLIYFFDSLLANTNLNIDAFSTVGNHCGYQNHLVISLLEKYYRNEPRLKFTNFQSRTGVFRIRQSLFVIDHGDSDTYERAKIPNNAQRESYIQSLILANTREYGQVTSVYFVQGDLHKTNITEYNDFVFIMAGSPSRSLYADAHNWNSRPSQLAFYLADNGIKNYRIMYFDDK